MSEVMLPVSFPCLIQRALKEYAGSASVFGISREHFFRPAGNGIGFFGERLGVPVGPAAGPHTQLAQNILAAYLSGARFMELKTVQAMDGEELRKCVPRPCINAEDEGYNVEWSTELTVSDAHGEYVKAWFLCHIFAKEFGISDDPDCIFNMSVGYSLDGIQSPKIDSFIEGMKNAKSCAFDAEIWKNCHDYMTANINAFNRFTIGDLDRISPQVSTSITLSTLHGCPREEIEKIASYLIAEKRLHCYVKCNPTLLGYETARNILDKMGYHYLSFDDRHFSNDLQFDDAVAMLARLKALAEKHRLGFGVKLTNTFPVQVRRNELPGTEMYMSGRSLFPLSISVAQKLSNAFNGELPISYSGGADYHNMQSILETGIRPVTLATAILKPGGYARFNQLAQIAETYLNSISQNPEGAKEKINVNALNALVDQLPKLYRYRKEYHPSRSCNSSFLIPPSSLPLFDCFKAPCAGSGCPIHQQIPAYLTAVAGGDYRGAFAIIIRDNTAPSITGTICDHQCQNLCARVNYEDPLQIRQAKKIAADNAQESFIDSLHPADLKTRRSVAVIGAGPAGVAAAVFLRRNGIPVTVYEKRDKPYGIVQYVIPNFRISGEAINRDFRMAKKYGVLFEFNVPEHYSIPDLQKKHDFIILATGAWKESASSDLRSQLHDPHYVNALRFLEESKKTNCGMELGKRVAVIGGGDVAMDCARAAKRNRGVEHSAIVYRRTREFMPSQYEEQELALADGVEFMELLEPEDFFGGTLRCDVMRLGDYGADGRRKTERTGEKRDLHFDTVISAVGAQVETGAFCRNGIALNAQGLPAVNAAGESSVPGVYLAGDCQSGAATVVRAIAGGKAAAADIIRKLGLEADFDTGDIRLTAAFPGFRELFLKKGIISGAKTDKTDAQRCLSCDALCAICVEVCPNRANIAVETGSTDRSGAQPLPFSPVFQIVHLDAQCNECGNCATFCPHGGKPYREKLTVFSGEDSFFSSGNPGFYKTGADAYRLRLEDHSVVEWSRGEAGVPPAWIAMVELAEAMVLLDSTY